MKGISLARFALVLCSLVAGSAAAQGIKWHPGHYMMLGTEDSHASRLNSIEEVGGERAVAGVLVRIRWADIETSRGVYDFSKLDAYLQRVKSRPTRKQLVIRIIDRSFNTTRSSGIVPDYMMTSAYNGGVVRTKTGYAARLWEPAVMDRLIALHAAIGRRYDDEARFEGLATEETTLALNQPFPGGYSHAALATQYRRLVRAVREAAPRSNFFLFTNFIGSPSVMDDLMQSLMIERGAAGGSNVFPGDKTQGQDVWTGVYGADYRLLLALSSGVETGELANYSPQQIGSWAYNELRLHHMFWVRNTWSSGASKRWHTGILPYLRTNPPVRTRCPDSYGWCVTN